MNENEKLVGPLDDSDALGAKAGAHFCVDADGVRHSEGNSPCPGFVPLRHELLALAAYWANALLFIETTFFYEQQIGSNDTRIIRCAHCRLDEIADALGPQAVDEAISVVAERYRTQMGEKDWAIFAGLPDDDDRVESLITAKHWDAVQGPGDGK